MSDRTARTSLECSEIALVLAGVTDMRSLNKPSKRLRGLSPLMIGNIDNFKRAARIELASLAWKAKVLPLNYARSFCAEFSTSIKISTIIEDFSKGWYFLFLYGTDSDWEEVSPWDFFTTHESGLKLPLLDNLLCQSLSDIRRDIATLYSSSIGQNCCCPVSLN